MSDYCVVLVDGGRARFFTLEPAEDTVAEGGPNLKEHEDLLNPEQEASGGELWSEVKSGRNRVPMGGQAHGYDDHRDVHLDEYRRRFARSVAREATRLARENHSKNIVLAAQSKMLGLVRNELDQALPPGVAVRDIAKDISKLSPQEVHKYLAREHLVPPRRSPGA